MSADLGPESNSWRFSSDDADVVFDLTRSMDGNTNGLQIKVSTGATIKTDPARCALVIIDMQNYFLSEALGRSRGFLLYRDRYMNGDPMLFQHYRENKAINETLLRNRPRPN